jgi:hypothetical protein
MIPRRIDREPENDSYRALALYVAAAGHEDEKALMSWTAGCLEPDDYFGSIREVEATQAQNTRAVKAKTYHLMVSFRPEDEDKLTPDILRDMELEFAVALGFGKHQRHCGVHRNTDNLHLHMAYNKIRPGNFKQIEPFRDFQKLSEVCRRLEQKYGLAVDRGADPERSPDDTPKVSAKVKSIEARTGQESLFSYIVRLKPEITAGLRQATDWNAVHTVFLQYGLQLKAAGNGLTINDRYGKYSAKASAIDRTWSKAKLETRFGLFEAPSAALQQTVKAIRSYTAAPVQVNPERDGLYQSFLTEIAERRTALEAIKQEGARLYTAHQVKWTKKHREMERLPMLNHDRRRVRLALKKRKQDELAALRAEITAQRNAARKERPYTSWNTYLQHLAAQGHETALAILRSRKEEVQPESTPEPPVSRREPDHIWASQKHEILKTAGITDHHRRALLSVVKMRELLAHEPDQPPPFAFRIDTKGTVIFILPGGTIRDTGREIHFSAGVEKIKELALKLAQSQRAKLARVRPEKEKEDVATCDKNTEYSR